MERTNTLRPIEPDDSACGICRHGYQYHDEHGDCRAYDCPCQVFIAVDVVSRALAQFGRTA